MFRRFGLLPQVRSGLPHPGATLSCQTVQKKWVLCSAWFPDVVKLLANAMGAMRSDCGAGLFSGWSG